MNLLTEYFLSDTYFIIIEIMKMFEHMTERYQIAPMPDQIGSEILAMLSSVSVATVGHLTWSGFLDHRHITPRQSDKRIVGTAITLRLPTPDSTLLHYASGRVRPGDIVVIDRAGDTRLACLGGNVAYALVRAGAAGAIVDGPICDPDEIREHDFPVWSSGVSPITTRRTGPSGSLNLSVNCGGVVVHAGDLIMADESGVICIPRAEAPALAKAAAAKESTSTQRRAAMQAGATLGALSSADELVAQHGVNVGASS
ncbi:RraA family protein [Shimia sp. R9_3]|uniref:RraA family protein n=1 Tax=Shimia sp. R9_3 TaxID=2821113 RepID=UPI001ADA85EC|nr:RraA family protein [Shimia sp. R9_3]MBO9402667.1 RraA family protein [Shimia sp. R9_3]